MIALASNYDYAAVWLSNLAADPEIIDHTDDFFVNEVLLRLAGSLRAIGAALRDAVDEGVVLQPHLFRRLYRRLAWTFRPSSPASSASGTCRCPTSPTRP